MEKTIERIYDLPDEQIVELTEEQILLYVDKELAIEKIPSIALSWGYEKVPDVIYPREGRSVIILKDLLIGFNNIEDASKIVNMLVKANAFKVDRRYLEGTFDAVYVGGNPVSPVIENNIIYTDEEVKMINERNKESEISSKKNKNETVNRAYDIRKKVLNFVNKTKEAYEYDNRLIEIFNRYIEIADGDKEKAMKFLKEAYEFGKLTDERIRLAHGMDQAQ